MNAVASTLESDQPLRVLGPQLTTRLALVTAAQRCLARDGFKVIRQDLRIGKHPRPLLHLGSDDRLRERFTYLARTPAPGAPRIAHARLSDVDLCWEMTS